MRVLASDIANDASSPTFKSNGMDWVCIGGNFAGDADATLMASPDGGTTWAQVSAETVFTAAAWYVCRLPAGVLLRVDVANGNGTTAIDVWVS